jgi:hypothetical protein
MIVHWIYTMVVRSLTAYSSKVWRPRVRCNVSRMELSRLERLASLAIAGAMKMTPIAAMEVLLSM